MKWYDPAQGSATAAVTLNRYKLIATGIPAMSYAIAANNCGKFDVQNPEDDRNFNMPANLKNPDALSLWPTNSAQNDPADWLHSDFKDVALPLVHPMYQKMIDLGNLDDD